MKTGGHHSFRNMIKKKCVVIYILKNGELQVKVTGAQIGFETMGAIRRQCWTYYFVIFLIFKWSNILTTNWRYVRGICVLENKERLIMKCFLEKMWCLQLIKERPNRIEDKKYLRVERNIIHVFLTKESKGREDWEIVNAIPIVERIK